MGSDVEYAKCAQINTFTCSLNITNCISTPDPHKHTDIRMHTKQVQKEQHLYNGNQPNRGLTITFSSSNTRTNQRW